MLSPSAKAWVSLLLVSGTTALLLWLVITKKVSLASIIVSLFALCLFIYGALEMAFALLDRWAVRSEMLSDVVRYVPPLLTTKLGSSFERNKQRDSP